MVVGAGKALDFPDLLQPIDERSNRLPRRGPVRGRASECRRRPVPSGRCWIWCSTWVRCTVSGPQMSTPARLPFPPAESTSEGSRGCASGARGPACRTHCASSPRIALQDVVG